MKRKLFALASALLALSLVLTACGSDDDDDSGNPSNPGGTGGTPTLQSLLASAADGSTIDLASTQATIEKADYTISANNFTLKNGDLKGSTVTVKGKGVTLEKLTNVDTVTIDKAVEESEFYLTETDLNLLTVNGGGSDSIHIKASTVQKIDANKEKVRIVLDAVSNKISRILSLYAKKSCKLDAEENASGEQSVFESVTVAADVESVTLAGSAKVEAIVTEKASTKILIDSNDVKIERAGTADDSGTVTVKATSETISVPTYTEISADDAQEAIEDTQGNIAKATLTGVYQFPTETPKSLTADDEGAYTLTIPMNEEKSDGWSTWLMAGVKLDGAAGKNYKFYFDVKTNVVATLGVKIRTSFCDGRSEAYTTVADKWTPLVGYTGVYEEGFSWLALEFIAAPTKSDVTLSVKNIRYEEVTDENDKHTAITNIYAKKGNQTDASVTANGDNTYTIAFTNTSDADYDVIGRVNVPTGTTGLYKISYTLTAEKKTTASSTIAFNSDGGYGSNWAFATDIQLGTNVPASITSYLVYTKETTSLAYDELHESALDKDKSAYLKIEVSTTKVNKITLSDIKAEPVSLTEMMSSTATAYPCWNGRESNYFVKKLDTENGDVLLIPANESIYGRLIFTRDPDDPWSAKNQGTNIVGCTNYLMWDEKAPSGVKIYMSGLNDNYDEQFKFENTTDKDIYLRIVFDKEHDYILHFDVAEETDTYLNKVYLEEGYWWILDDDATPFEKNDSGLYTTEFTWKDEDYGYKLLDISYSDGKTSETSIYHYAALKDNLTRFAGWAFKTNFLKQGETYKIVITPNDSDPLKAEVALQGEFLELPEIVNEDGTWWYLDIENKIIEDNLWIIFNTDESQTGDIFAENAYENGVVWYAIDKEFQCTPSTAETKPSHTKVDNTIRVYVQTPADIEAVNLYWWAWGDHPEWPGTAMKPVDEVTD